MNIYSYDLNKYPSGLEFFRSRAEEKGIKITEVDSLSNVKDADVLMINPLEKEIYKEHWEEIKKYISRDKNTRILFFAPFVPEEDIKTFLDNPKNVEYIATEELSINRKIKWETLWNLLGATK